MFSNKSAANFAISFEEVIFPNCPTATPAAVAAAAPANIFVPVLLLRLPTAIDAILIIAAVAAFFSASRAFFIATIA